MPIVIDTGAAAITGLAAYGVGRGKYFRRQQEAWLPIVAQQQEQAHQQELARQKYLQQAHQQRVAGRQQAQLAESQQEFRAAESAAERQFVAGESEAQRTFRAGEAQAGRQFSSAEAQAERDWRTGESDIRFAQQVARDENRFAQEQQLSQEDWQRRLDARLDEGLMTGELFYTDEQKREMANIESAAMQMQTNPFFDESQRTQGLERLRAKYEAIRRAPHSARADERALSQEERVKRSYIRTPGGQEMWTQPDGQQIQLRPHEDPEASRMREAQAEIAKLEHEINLNRLQLQQEVDSEGNPLYDDPRIEVMMAPLVQEISQRKAALEASRVESQQPAQGDGVSRSTFTPARVQPVAHPQSREEFDALKPGTRYQLPDGREGTK